MKRSQQEIVDSTLQAISLFQRIQNDSMMLGIDWSAPLIGIVTTACMESHNPVDTWFEIRGHLLRGQL